MRYAALLAVATAFALFGSARPAEAQYVYVAGYAPAPVYVSPAPTVVYRPVTPVVAYSPVIAAPAPVAVAPAVVGGPVVTTRYRPFLGGTVTRVRYRYAPAAVYTPIY
ncbi:hypothetical protein MalM25_13500 [Planctomycetes bacterium MalM25]|nr:hypothetical protein MalM25_13500 [Planctomycetes bacterium MalM25]